MPRATSFSIRRDDVGDVLGGVGRPCGRRQLSGQNPQKTLPHIARCSRAASVLVSRDALDDFVLHVGDVHDVADGEALEFASAGAPDRRRRKCGNCRYGRNHARWGRSNRGRRVPSGSRGTNSWTERDKVLNNLNAMLGRGCQSGNPVTRRRGPAKMGHPRCPLPGNGGQNRCRFYLSRKAGRAVIVLKSSFGWWFMIESQ